MFLPPLMPAEPMTMDSASPSLSSRKPRFRRRRNFIERAIAGLLQAMQHALDAEEMAKKNGLLQCLDPRVKVVGLPALIVASALSHQFSIIGAIFAIAVILAVLSRVPLRTLVVREWLGVLVFTGLIALPAIFITPGEALYRLPWPGWTITVQGLRSALFLVARVETAATLSLLLVLCTPWTQLLKALRVLRMPVVMVVILGMTHRYIFLMLQVACDMFEARQSRMVGALDGRQSRRLAASSAGVLLSKTFYLSNEVYLAMQSRGFRGEMHTLDEFQMKSHDWMALAVFLTLAALAVWYGRY